MFLLMNFFRFNCVSRNILYQKHAAHDTNNEFKLTFRNKSRSTKVDILVQS